MGFETEYAAGGAVEARDHLAGIDGDHAVGNTLQQVGEIVRGQGKLEVFGRQLLIQVGHALLEVAISLLHAGGRLGKQVQGLGQGFYIGFGWYHERFRPALGR